MSLLKQSGLKSNFKNIVQTIAKRHQGWLCYYTQATLHSNSIEVSPTTKVGLLKDEPDDIVGNILPKVDNTSDNTTLARPSWIKFSGYEYRSSDCYILMSVDEYKNPTFAKIMDIYLIDSNTVILSVRVHTTVHFYRHFHSYIIEPSMECKLVALNELKDYTCYHARKTFHSEQLTFISLKYNLEPDCVH